MNTNDNMQPTSSASMAEMSKEDVIVLAMAASAMSDRKVEQALEVLQKEAAKRSAIVPPVVQAPTDRQILDFASYAYNRGGLSVGFTDVAALDKFREIVGVAAPIVATVPSEPVAWMWSYRGTLRVTTDKDEAIACGSSITPLYAAPSTAAEQASDVRNAALEEAALACEKEEQRIRNFADVMALAACGTCADRIRAIKSATLANKGNAPAEAAKNANNDLLTYVLQDEVHNRLTPRVIDIAYTAFMCAKQPNEEDGGASDWFTDTRPVVLRAIEQLRNELAKDQA